MTSLRFSLKTFAVFVIIASLVLALVGVSASADSEPERRGARPDKSGTPTHTVVPRTLVSRLQPIPNWKDAARGRMNPVHQRTLSFRARWYWASADSKPERRGARPDESGTPTHAVVPRTLVSRLQPIPSRKDAARGRMNPVHQRRLSFRARWCLGFSRF